MKNACIPLLVVSAVALCMADVPLTDNTNVVFATPEKGTEILTGKDEYIQSLSPFDRSARLQTAQPVSEKQFLDFVAKDHTLAWTEDEKQQITTILQGLRENLKPFSLPFPETVYLIKTDGAIEGGAAYTRSIAVILPRQLFQAQGADLTHLVAHELFHVLSRANPELRGRLYEAIGFKSLAKPFEFPADLADRKITNPDAPAHEHYIEVKYEGKTRRAVPITYARQAYDANLGGTFFNYLMFRFVLLPEDGLEQTLADTYQLDGFMQQVGANTDYIIHPEEILADNFALIATGRTSAPSPDLLNKIKSVLLNTAEKPAN